MTEVRMTLEELAIRADVPPQRAREWESFGLLRPSPHGGFDAEALERARLLRFATERGISADDIAAANEREGRDVLGRFLEYLGRPGGPGCSIEEAATLLGLDEAFLRRVWIAGGLGDRDEWLFEEDLEAMRAVAMALEAGLPEEALVQIVRVMADALGRVADAVTRLFHFYVHERLRSEGLAPEVATAGTQEASDALTGLVEPSILYVHRKAWVRAMREDLVLHLAEDVAPADAPVAQLPVAVLFVDLASFTPLTEAMGDAAAAEVLDRFSDLVREEAIHCEGRVLKQIGDEFMLVFPNARAAVSYALDLADRAGAEAQFPALRMGVHVGTALYRDADYLGATVNVAARVTTEARRGQLLATTDVRDAVDELEGVTWQPLGRRRLKGLGEPVELYDVQRAGRLSSRVVDPVCGMELDPGQCDIRESWRGSDVYFCTEACRDLFRRDPARYVA